MAEQRDDHVVDLDLDRQPRPAGPRVWGAQWDELRGVWERWDEQSQAWVVVGEGTPVPQPEVGSALAATSPPDLDDGAAHIGGHVIIDLDRVPRPEEPAVPGAQWNEVVGRWEVWSESAGRWVDANRSAPTR